ncbi:MAG: hypothetical protein E4H41_09880 [Gemmatimonadales bacterium]|jgi:hypothetical protein|nr:MAG: hypothetical protein E4H41_09880 [Gemmatimonadales bacterium]
MSLLLLLALQQAPLPQVGDTVWLVRTIPAPIGRVARVAPWNPEGAVEALGPGMLVRRGDSLEVRYPAVGWLPGSHTVEVPGPVLVSPDGTTDSLPPATLTVTIASVLPTLPGDSLPPAQPEAAPILRPIQTAVPVLVLLLLAVLLLIPVHFWWRKRGRPVTAPSTGEAQLPPSLPLETWMAAGEPRAVLAASAARLRAASSAHPSPEAAALLQVLDDALFGPGDVSAVLPRAEAAVTLAVRLEEDPPA